MPVGGAAVGSGMGVPVKPAPVPEGKRKASKNKKAISVVAMDKEQIDNLMAYHYQKYGEKEEISCPACRRMKWK